MRFMQRVKAPLIVVIALLLIAALLIWFVRPPASGNAVVYIGEPLPRVKLPAPSFGGPLTEPRQVPEGFKAIATQGYLRLYFHEQEYKVAVADLRTGYIWYSTPVDAGEEQPNALFNDLLHSLVRVTYQLNNRDQPVTVGFAGAKKSVATIDDGVRINVHYEQPQIAFDLEVVPADDGLEVSVPV